MRWACLSFLILLPLQPPLPRFSCVKWVPDPRSTPTFGGFNGFEIVCPNAWDDVGLGPWDGKEVAYGHSPWFSK